MNDSHHIPPARLEQFVAGQLNEKDADEVVAHLGGCDLCLAAVDALWRQLPAGSTATEIEELDADTARRMGQRVARTIRRSNLGGAAIKMGTQGFLAVALAMLRPLFGASNLTQAKGVDHD